MTNHQKKKIDSAIHTSELINLFLFYHIQFVNILGVLFYIGRVFGILIKDMIFVKWDLHHLGNEDRAV